MDMVMDKVNEYYEMFMELTPMKKGVVLLIVGLVAYYGYKHFGYAKGLEDGKNGVLRFFHADWCPHNKVKPEWDRLKKIYYKGDVALKAVDCSKDRPAIAKQLKMEELF